MKEKTWEEICRQIYEFFVRNAPLFGSILIGVVAKIAFENRNRTLTLKQTFVKVTLSVVVGYLVGYYMKIHGKVDEMPIYVPLATLLGESIVVGIMNNSKQWIKDLAQYLTKK